MRTFDCVLTNKIGFGKGQIQQFSVLCLVDFLDGFITSLLTLLISQLQHQWQLNQVQVMGLATCYFLGMLCGILFQGLYSDIIGRRKMLCISMLGTFIVITLHALVQNYNQLIVIRFFFGSFFGISIPLSLILMSEQVPLAYRGRVVAALQLSFLFGIYYMLICVFIFLENYEEGNWRGIFILNSIPALLCFLGSIFFLSESPRFYLSKKRYEECFEILNNIGHKNNEDYQDLTQEEKEMLIQSQLNQIQLESHSFIELFKNGNAKVTISLWIIMFLWGIQCTSLFLLIPFIFREAEIGLSALAIGYLMELPASLIVISLIDSEKYGGRKRMVSLGLFMYSCSELMMFFFGKNTIIFGMTLIRICDKLIWISVNQLKIESYATNLRTLGVGAADSISKIGSTLATIIAFWLFYKNPNLPFVVFGFMTFITLAFTLRHPIDLTQKPLDQNFQIIDNEQDDLLKEEK